MEFRHPGIDQGQLRFDPPEGPGAMLPGLVRIPEILGLCPFLARV